MLGICHRVISAVKAHCSARSVLLFPIRARGETAKPCNLLKLTAIVTRRVPTTKQRWGPGAVQKPQQKTERRSQLRVNVPNANTYSIACMKESYKNEKPAEEITQ
jgi:hypothetical protein